MKSQYIVHWEGIFEAECPIEAAKMARDLIRTKCEEANTFQVAEAEEKIVPVTEFTPVTTMKHFSHNKSIEIKMNER